jgi:hypothetical protein
MFNQISSGEMRAASVILRDASGLGTGRYGP